MNMEAIRNTVNEHGQGHLLRFWDKLNDDQKKSFHDDLAKVDFAEVKELFTQAQNQLKEDQEKKDDLLEPLPASVFQSVANVNEEELGSWYEEGLRQVALGKVGVLLLAGGQGTRLGVTYPKGMYNVDLPSKKTLYQLQAERILRLQEIARKKNGGKGCITWYIMTSEATRPETEAFFAKHNYFGLESSNVVLFEQHTLPCLTFEGKLILDSNWKLARAPDGNGGLYKALKSQKIVENMESRGIEYVHVYCVDNVLVRVADPVFVGYCIAKKANCGAKVCEKVEPTEAVGVVCRCKGKYQVVEYSEISKATSEKRGDNGKLLFNAGNICNHFFTIDFLKEILSDHLSVLPHHVAKKKIPYVNDSGERIKPDTPSGIKLEKFVFDVFQFSDRFAVLEVPREDEFSPLKNSPSVAKDSPVSCRKHLMNLHSRYVIKAGGSFTGGSGNQIDPSNSSVEINCEISPLLSYSGEGIGDHVQGRKFLASETLYLRSEVEMTCDQASNGDGPGGKKSKLE